MSDAAPRASRALAPGLGAALLLGACLDLGGGPSFPIQDRVGAGESALALIRRADDGRDLRARFDAAGFAALEPGFAVEPWSPAELELALAAALGAPLVRRGATLSPDPASAAHLLATDAQGRVLRFELDPAGATRSIELVTGFAAALPRRWSVERSARALVLRSADGRALNYELR